MKSDDLMLMAYVDGALNRAGRLLIERRLTLDAELRATHIRLQQTAQLTKLSVVHHSDDNVNHRTIGMLLNTGRSVARVQRFGPAVTHGVLALLFGIVLGACLTFGIGSMNGDMRSVQGLDRVKGGYRS